MSAMGTVQSDGENPPIVGTTPIAARSLCGATGRTRPAPVIQVLLDLGLFVVQPKKSGCVVVEIISLLLLGKEIGRQHRFYRAINILRPHLIAPKHESVTKAATFGATE